MLKRRFFNYRQISSVEVVCRFRRSLSVGTYTVDYSSQQNVPCSHAYARVLAHATGLFVVTAPELEGSNGDTRLTNKPLRAAVVQIDVRGVSPPLVRGVSTPLEKTMNGLSDPPGQGGLRLTQVVKGKDLEPCPREIKSNLGFTSRPRKNTPIHPNPLRLIPGCSNLLAVGVLFH